MKKVIPLFVLIVLCSGCASMKLGNQDLACAINDIVLAQCNLGTEKSVEVCNISRQLKLQCQPKESKAKLFEKLQGAMATP